MTRIAYIGLGTMGMEMARRLVGLDVDLVIWNRSSGEAVDELERAGARRAESVVEAMDADIVFSMLADDTAVLERFDESTLGAARRGSVHVNMSTISVETAVRLTDAHRAAGIAYVAAPVLGRPPVAAAGELNILAGGAADAIAAAAPYLDVLGKRTWIVGDEPRTANLVKIAVNYNLIHALQALAESVTLVEQGGVDGGQFVDILTDAAFTGSAYSGYGPMIAARDYSPALFSLPLGLKDLGLAEGAAASEGVSLPSAGVLRDLFERALADPDLDGLDWSAVAEVTRAMTVPADGAS